MGLFDLMTLLLTWGVYLFILQREAKSIHKHTKLIENRFSGYSLLKIKLTDCENFSRGAGTPGTERDIAFSVHSRR
jgi:hypothetical protein